MSLSDTVVRGELLAFTPDTLVVRTDSGEVDVPFTAVNEARRKRMGFLLGTIIGAAAGVGPALALGSLLSNEGHDTALPMLFVIGSGAGIGAGIDAMLNRNRTVFRREAGARVSVAPSIARTHAGLQVSVAW